MAATQRGTTASKESAIQPRTGRPPTIIEVAAEANVSKSTVSNVIRNSPVVSGATRDRVLEVIKRIGYQPNVVARQLVQQRTTILGVVVGDLTNSFHAEIATYIERCASEHGYTAMLCNVEGDPDQSALGIQSLVQQRIVGMLVLTPFGSSEHVRGILPGAVPVMSVGIRPNWGDWVSVNDYAGDK